MELYTRIQGHGPSVITLHGLFGSNENLGGISRALAERFTVYGIDLRNHGRSPHGEPMDYPTLAADVADTMQSHGITSAALIGHSMGGKTAMELALARPELVDRLVVLDIAPVAYDAQPNNELEAMRALDLASLVSRADADQALANRIPHPEIRQFLLKNLRRAATGFEWRIPLDTIARSYSAIAAAPTAEGSFERPALFLRGGTSEYVPDEALASINERFPSALIETVPGAAHWLHFDSPQSVSHRIYSFLSD